MYYYIPNVLQASIIYLMYNNQECITYKEYCITNDWYYYVLLYNYLCIRNKVYLLITNISSIGEYV